LKVLQQLALGDTSTREIVARSVAEFGCIALHQSLSLLRELARDRNLWVALQVTISMVSIAKKKPREVLEATICWAHDRDAKVRYTSVLVLGELVKQNRTNVLKTVTMLTNDAHRVVRTEAVNVLYRLLSEKQFESFWEGYRYREYGGTTSENMHPLSRIGLGEMARYVDCFGGSVIVEHPVYVPRKCFDSYEVTMGEAASYDEADRFWEDYRCREYDEFISGNVHPYVGLDEIVDDPDSPGSAEGGIAEHPVYPPRNRFDSYEVTMGEAASYDDDDLPLHIRFRIQMLPIERAFWKEE
jgi:hypothetical protein